MNIYLKILAILLMVLTMTKSKLFYLSLLIIYLLFLSKDTLFSLFNSSSSNLCLNTYYQKEYEKLSQELNISPNNYKVLNTKVLLRDIYEFYDKLTINVGTNNNVQKGDALINSAGLVGIINKTYRNYSEVYLLTNNNLNLSVKVNDSYGILTSKDNTIIVKNIKINNPIKPGDLVYTSGLASIPGDILIGEVSSVTPNSLGLEYLVQVKPQADFFNLNYLGVVIP